MLSKLRNNIALGINWKNVYQKKLVFYSQIKIKNQQIAKELEQECNNKNGILTYAEYLDITQFGKHGYYARSNRHGKTDVETRWATALANYCQKQNFHTIIEFGCGAGELGIATVNTYQQKTKKQLSWIGIERDKQLHPKIIANFQHNKQQNALKSVCTSLDEIKPQENTLLIFPYSLDNLSPQVFLNTNEGRSYPNTLMGIVVKHGMVSEVPFTSETLEKKQISITNGIYKQDSFQFDITSWKVRKGQQAFIPIAAYTTLAAYTTKWKEKANLLIIDEYREDPWFFSLEHRGIPRSLYEKNLICYDRKRYYVEAAKHNFYYPHYKSTLLKFLYEIGFRSIEDEIEQKMAAHLQGKHWIPVKKKYNTFAITATSWMKNNKRSLSISCNWKKLM